MALEEMFTGDIISNIFLIGRRQLFLNTDSNDVAILPFISMDGHWMSFGSYGSMGSFGSLGRRIPKLGSLTLRLASYGSYGSLGSYSMSVSDKEPSYMMVYY